MKKDNKSIDDEIKEAKKRKKEKVKETSILEEKVDTSFLDIEKEKTRKEKKKKEEKNKIEIFEEKKEVKEKKIDPNKITLRGEEFFIKEEHEEKKIDDKNHNKKSILGIFFLILSLIAIGLYSYKIYNTLDFKSLKVFEILKSFSFSIISLITILVLFKLNNQKNKFYIVLLSLLLIGYTIFSYSYAKEDVLYVSNFINKDYSEVLAWAEKYKIDLTTLHEFSDTVEYNHVIMQEYGIDKLVSEIKAFTVTISDGPNLNKEIVVPNFIGFKFDDVMKYIKENHLSNVEIDFIISDKERDTVIEQTGSGTMKRNDLIKLIFSYGEEIETTEVKDLKELSLFEATTYLKRYGIKYNLEYEFNDKIKRGYVISQDKINEVVEELNLKISKGKEIIVPNFSNMTTTEIAKWASTNNIKIKYESIYNKDLENGKFIKASINENEKIEEETEIIITLSKGSLIMPEVKNISDFKLWATNNNIHYEENLEFSTTIKSGELISVSPKAGEKITENDTIVLTISKGKSVTTPNLIGLTKSEVTNKCKNIGLTCTFKYGGLTESTKKDVSISQSKKSGLTVAEGTNITVTLSSGIIEKVNVPSYVGKSKSEIESSCNSLGITCKFSYNNSFSSTPKDNAISQDKKGNMNKGSTINITLSKGSAQTYTVIIDGSLLSLGNPEQTKNTLKNKLESSCPGVTFNFSFKPANSGIGYLNQDSQVKVGSNTFTQGKSYNVIINSN